MNLTSLDPDLNHREPKGWSNHPAVKMWRGYEGQLFLYGLAMVDEWRKRGYNSTLDAKLLLVYNYAFVTGRASGVDVIPSWIADQSELNKVLDSHRRALLTKNYGHYSCLSWSQDSGVEPTAYTYYWAV